VSWRAMSSVMPARNRNVMKASGVANFNFEVLKSANPLQCSELGCFWSGLVLVLAWSGLVSDVVLLIRRSDLVPYT